MSKDAIFNTPPSCCVLAVPFLCVGFVAFAQTRCEMSRWALRYFCLQKCKGPRRGEECKPGEMQGAITRATASSASFRAEDAAMKGRSIIDLTHRYLYLPTTVCILVLLWKIMEGKTQLLVKKKFQTCKFGVWGKILDEGGYEKKLFAGL